MVERPWWLGAGVILFGCLWLYQASQLPLFAQYAELGPGFVVFLVGAGLVVSGIILTFQIWRGESFEAQEAEDVDVAHGPSMSALLIAVAAAAVPLLTMQPLGFPVTATLSFLLMTRAFGSRRYLLNTLIGAALALICWYGFEALGVRLGGLFPPLGV